VQRRAWCNYIDARLLLHGDNRASGDSNGGDFQLASGYRTVFLPGKTAFGNSGEFYRL
jgi:hypothetical protein